MISEHSYVENSLQIFTNNNSNDGYLNVILNLQLYKYNRVSSLFGEITLINNQFQIFTSLILCIVGLIGALFHIRILIRRYFHIKSFSHHIFIQSLFDSCHLINILFTHTIVIIVYIKTSTNIDLYCPLSTFFFSLASIGSISFLCLGAFNRYMYLFKKQAQYRCIRHRLLAHRFILIASMSWLILNFPKLNFSENF
jgi:hypothetical protein